MAKKPGIHLLGEDTNGYPCNEVEEKHASRVPLGVGFGSAFVVGLVSWAMLSLFSTSDRSPDSSSLKSLGSHATTVSGAIADSLRDPAQEKLGLSATDSLQSPIIRGLLLGDEGSSEALLYQWENDDGLTTDNE